MTRFLMTLDESIDLIENAISQGDSGDFWIPQLRSMKIADLAEIFSERYSKPVVEIGIRPGEKLHEELISQTESLRAVKSQNHKILLKPESYSLTENSSTWSYSSADDNLDKSSLLEFLNSRNVFEAPLESFLGREIEEIRMSNSQKE